MLLHPTDIYKRNCKHPMRTTDIYTDELSKELYFKVKSSLFLQKIGQGHVLITLSSLIWMPNNLLIKLVASNKK